MSNEITKKMSIDQQLELLIEELQVYDQETGDSPSNPIDMLLVKIQLVVAKIIAEDVITDMIDDECIDSSYFRKRINHYVSLWSSNICNFTEGLINQQIKSPSLHSTIH